VSLAENLTAARAAAGLSQQKVADTVGIPRPSLSDIERGKRSVDAMELKAFADLYGTTADALLGGEPMLPSVRTPDGLMVRMEKVTNDLHGYLEQRARELAQPRIQVAEEEAALRVLQICGQLQRAKDLEDELRRQYAAAVKRAHRAEHRLDIKHTAGECGTCDEARLEAKKGTPA
jgi:transcriptional regulator with XRE-family HTH domain